jgi:carboxyl-terminal processing protease
LILDLRYNGGGSIEEAIDLAGIFIDAGPLAFMKFRNAKPVVLKDMNRGMVFGGKLLVLVNGLSASASEFVAGILQDYNRAIIAGSPTYGKATSQIVLPLNLRENISSNSSATDGYVKVTEGKLYRLDGESNQVRGVVPDILLPDLYEGILPREEDSGNFLIRDTINKKTPYSALPSLEREKLRRNSENRITKNIVLANTVEKNKELNISYHNTKVVLMPEPFYKWKKHVDSYFNTETKTLSSDKQFKVESNTFDKSLMELDEFRRDFIRQNNENILQDAEVGEAYSILEDMITFSR